MLYLLLERSETLWRGGSGGCSFGCGGAHLKLRSQPKLVETRTLADARAACKSWASSELLAHLFSIRVGYSRRLIGPHLLAEAASSVAAKA
jgi:hypothetical protein